MTFHHIRQYTVFIAVPGSVHTLAALALNIHPVLQGDDALDVVGGGQRLHPHIIIYQHQLVLQVGLPLRPAGNPDRSIFCAFVTGRRQ